MYLHQVLEKFIKIFFQKRPGKRPKHFYLDYQGLFSLSAQGKSIDHVPLKKNTRDRSRDQSYGKCWILHPN